MADTTKLPIKTEKTGLSPAPAQWMPFDSLRREVDRIFDNFRHGMWDFPLRRAFEFELPWPRETGSAVAPAVDVAEREKEFEITAELPGMDTKDIEIKLSNGMLTIKGEKKEEKEERNKGYYLSERRYGSFTRSFRVPDGVDTAKIEAAFTKGVLTVKLPKSAEAQKAETTIAVKAA
ncbi:MAG: Hsp20/alpha crystallin family protein [Beijerinckiaceae bacterium]|nr:Hsp20/alpha crystallin family protein [Beijerinckiaceae bacterium]